MTADQKIIRAKVGLLELAKQLGNVSQACKMMGYSRDLPVQGTLRARRRIGAAGNQPQEAGVKEPRGAGDRGRHRNAGHRAAGFRSAPSRQLKHQKEKRSMAYFAGLDVSVKKTSVRDDDVCRRLMTVPGVGPVVALTYRATVDVPARFRNSKAVGAVFGLTPAKYQSGEIHPGRTTRTSLPASPSSGSHSTRPSIERWKSVSAMSFPRIER